MAPACRSGAWGWREAGRQPCPHSPALAPHAFPGPRGTGAGKAPGARPALLPRGGGSPLLRPRSLIHGMGAVPRPPTPVQDALSAKRISEASGSNKCLIARVRLRRNSPEGRATAAPS